jgi:acetyl esterase
MSPDTTPFDTLASLDAEASLDAQTRRLLEKMSAHPVVLDVAAMRAQEAASLPPLAIERARVAATEDRAIDGPLGAIPIRIYYPRPSDQHGEKPPLLLYFHGGGQTIGSLDSHDGILCQLCQGSGFIAVAVGYRLAPEHKFPAAPEDCYAALLWLGANGAALGGDTSRIVVAGDSAGGNLAAVVCLLARDRRGPTIGYQVLLYPSTTGRAATATRQRYGRGYFLTIELMDWFAAQYFAHPDDKHQPLYAVINADLAELPPALIITAEFDPLRDDGELYASRLEAAGVSAEYRCYDGTIHGFVSFYHFLDLGQAALALVAGRLRNFFGDAASTLTENNSWPK